MSELLKGNLTVSNYKNEEKDLAKKTEDICCSPHCSPNLEKVEDILENCTFTTLKSDNDAQELTIEKLQEIVKMFPDPKLEREREKALGLQAMNLKYNHTEYYNQLSLEDMRMVENAIDRRKYIIEQERLEDLKIIRNY